MNTEGIKGKFGVIIRKYGIYLMLLVLIMIGTLLSDVFLTGKNFMSIGRQVSVIGIIALAETLLIICGNVDLSLGSVVAFSGMISINVYLATNSFVVAFLVAILIGALCTSGSAGLITKLGMPGFIATMSMDFIIRGLTFIYCDGTPIYQVGDFGKISTTYIFGVVPLPVVFLVTLTIITAILLNETVLGRNLYAVGGNDEAARATGISVGKTKLKAFAIAGMLTGIAGVIQMARLNTGLPDTATGYHGDAIASAVIGGASLSGGTGTAVGTLAGAFIIGIISNILNLKGVSSYTQQVVKGLIIIIAVSFDVYGKNRKIKRIQQA